MNPQEPRLQPEPTPQPLRPAFAGAGAPRPIFDFTNNPRPTLTNAATVTTPATSTPYPTYVDPAPVFNDVTAQGASLESTVEMATEPVIAPTPVVQAPPSISPEPATLQVDQAVPLIQPEQPAAPQFTQNIYTEEPKRHLSFSQQFRVAVMVLVFAAVMAGGVFFTSRLRSDNKAKESSSSQLIPEQDLTGGNLIVGAPSNIDVQNLTGQSLIVNGDIVTTGGLKFYNDQFISSVLQSNATADRTVTLPDADGTFCLDSNNCNYASATQFSAVQTQVNAITVPVKSIQAGTNVTVTDLGNGVFNISSAGGSGGAAVTTLTVPEGGTGLTSFNANGVVYGNSTGALGVTVAGTSGQCLVGNTGSAPSWTSCIGIAGGATPGGLAGGDLSGTYPNPTIGKLQGTNLLINTPAAGNILVYSAANSRWDNVAVSGDVAIGQTGVATVQANSVALSTDTTGNYVSALGTVTGLTVGSNTGEGSTPTISVNYGSSANTAVEGNQTITITAGTNLTGGGSITLGAGGSVTINGAASQTLSDLTLTTPLGVSSGGTGNNAFTQYGVLFGNGSGALGVTVAGANNECLVGNTGAAPSWIACNIVSAGATPGGTAGGDLGGTYPNPTIAKLQGTDLLVNTPTAGQILIYNNTNSRWDNRTISSDVVISQTGVATIQSGAVALSTDVTGTLGITNGGTGQGSAQAAINALSGLSTNGDLLYHNGSNAVRLARGSNTQCLTSSATTILWGACESPNTILQNGNSFTGAMTIGTNDNFGLNLETNNTTVASLSSTGQALFKNASNSTSAFQVQNSAGTNLLALDTTNMSINAGAALSFSFFPSRTDYASGASGSSVVTADFNGDSKIDYALTNTIGAMSVYMNNGDGTFAARVDYTTAASSNKDILSADFNNDGKADLAVYTNASTSNPNTLSIFMNNGDGTFAARVDYTVATSVGTFTGQYGLASSDFNSDGYADIAVTQPDSATMSVFMNNGNGTFAAKVDYVTGTGPWGIVSGDVNGDGKADIVLVAHAVARASVFMNNGNGTFAAKVDYVTGTGPAELALADLNNDGKLDIATVNDTSTSISVLLNLGSGIFGTKTDYTTSAAAKGIVASDFNGDGRLDLATATGSSSALSVFMNTGNGIFAAKVNYAVIDSPQSIAAADFNSDGKPDLVTANVGSGATASSVLLNQATAPSSPTLKVSSTAPGKIAEVIQASVGQSADITQVQDAQGNVLARMTADGVLKLGSGATDLAFAAKVDYAAGTAPLIVATADFNGDGKTDLAEANNSSGANSVSVLLGNGDGTLAARIDYTTGSTPNGLASADLNGDGKPDLVITNGGTTTLSVLMNNGDGTFATKVDYTTGSTPSGVAAADLNGDGKADLAVANSGSVSMSILMNNGDGTFATKVDYTTGTAPRGVTAADLNGDGKLDLAVTNNSSATMSVFINNGNGTFATKVDYSTGTTPSLIASGDLNGDGRADIAVANGSTASSSVSVFINNGNGTFATKVDYAGASAVYGVTIADLNGDGKLDLAATNQNAASLSIFLNNGDGTFATKVDYTTGTAPRGITTGDFNGDSKPDMAVANLSSTTISVYINQYRASRLRVSTSSPSVVGQIIQGSVGQTADLLQLNDSTGVAVFGIGASGAINTAMLVKNTANSTTAFQIQTSTGTSLLTADTVNMGITVGSSPTTALFATKVDYTTGNPTSGSNQNPRAIAAADFNGDGKLDLAITNNNTTTMSVFINNGNGTYAAKVDYTTGTSPLNIAAADFTGDGKPDLAVTNNGGTSMSVFINNGNGTFATKVDYATTTATPQGIAAADLNGDGKADIVVSNTSFTLSVFINNGNGTFAAKVDYATGGNPYDVTLADFNADGKADIAVVNNNSPGGMSTFMNNGDGTFATKVDYTTLGTNNKGITSADFNGDGKPDIAVAGTGNGSGTVTSIFMNTGSGTMATRVDYTVGTQPTGISAADFNLDGRPDLITANVTSSSMSVLLNNGNGTFGAKLDTATSSSPLSLATGDFNNDTKPDVALTYVGSNKLSVFMSVLPSGTAAPALKVANAAANNVAQVIQAASFQAGDLLQVQDATGRVLAKFTKDGSLNLEDANTSLPQSVFATKADYTTATHPRSPAVADFNGDGKADLAVPNDNATSVSVFMNTGNGAFAAKVDYTTGSQPTGAAAGDFNGDGKADIAVSNSGTTTLSVFINNGDGTFATKVDYTTGTGPQRVNAVDYNGDGKIDLATDNITSNTVSVLLGVGNGTFATKVDYPLLSTPTDMISADFNGDGKADIAVVGNFNPGSISILMNNGNGTFATKVDYTTTVSNPEGIAAGDFNGDGKIDLAVSIGKLGGGDTMSVYINSGSGTFPNKVDYAAGAFPTAVTAADFNGDGKIDLAFSNASATTASVFYGFGNGAFAQKVDYTVGTGPKGIAFGDFNNDGRQDLAVGNTNGGGLSVLINQFTPTALARLKVVSNAVGTTGQIVQALSGQTADLFQATSATGSVLMNITAAGKVGMGVTAPTYKLSVADTQNATVSVATANLSTTDSSSVGVMRLNLGTAATGTASRFLQFYAASTADNNGTGVGRIRLNNTGVAYETGGADFAEYFDVTENVEPGDIISVTSTGNSKAVQGTQLLGVVSDTAAFVGNAKSEEPLANQAIVGLAGQVKTKVSTENGAIVTGDRLAVSSVAGVAMKANPGDATIGIALEGYSGVGVARIAVLLDTTQAQADLQSPVQNGDNVSFADLNVGGLAQMANLTVTGNVSVQGTLTVHTAVVTGNLKVGGHIITTGQTPSITVNTTALGASAGVVIEGTDTAGTIRITPSQGSGADKLAEITFSQAFTSGKQPRVVVSAANNGTAQAQVFSDDNATSNTGFELWSAANLQSGQTYVINYLIVE